MIGSDSFVEIIIDHAHWGRPAGGEALGEFNGKVSAWRNGDRVVVRIALRAVDAGELTQAVHQFVGPTHGAGQGAANADVEFSRSGLTETRIKRDHFEYLNRFKIEFVRDPVDSRG